MDSRTGGTQAVPEASRRGQAWMRRKKRQEQAPGGQLAGGATEAGTTGMGGSVWREVWGPLWGALEAAEVTGGGDAEGSQGGERKRPPRGPGR